MRNKQDAFYFDTFIECAKHAYDAGNLLYEIIKNFDISTIEEKLEKLHEIEHAADLKKHLLTSTLARAFVTPIDREDILLLGQNIDEVTDKIEDVLIRIYYNHLTEIPENAIRLTEIVCRCLSGLLDMMTQLKNFKKVGLNSLTPYIVLINTTEEEADKLYISAMYELHNKTNDPLYVIGLREVYSYLEKCADACEHVADVVQSVILKNT